MTIKQIVNLHEEDIDINFKTSLLHYSASAHQEPNYNVNLSEENKWTALRNIL